MTDKKITLGQAIDQIINSQKVVLQLQRKMYNCYSCAIIL